MIRTWCVACHSQVLLPGASPTADSPALCDHCRPKPARKPRKAAAETYDLPDPTEPKPKKKR